MSVFTCASRNECVHGSWCLCYLGMHAGMSRICLCMHACTWISGHQGSLTFHPQQLVMLVHCSPSRLPALFQRDHTLSWQPSSVLQPASCIYAQDASVCICLCAYMCICLYVYVCLHEACTSVCTHVQYVTSDRYVPCKLEFVHVFVYHMHAYVST